MLFGDGKGRGAGDNREELEPWRAALEALFVEALISYYEGTPMFDEREFQTLRDELEYLGSGAVRLAAAEKLWVLVTQQRDFDRQLRMEFGMSEEELERMKRKLMAGRAVKRPRGSLLVQEEDYGRGARTERGSYQVVAPSRSSDQLNERRSGRSTSKFAADADKVEADNDMDERLRFLLFGEAVEEKIKLAILYLPAALTAMAAASILTMLFALLDGEMVVSISSMGRIRLGILSYAVVVGTVWFTNTATPMVLDYLDLGKPVLLKAKCPNCMQPVSCLFTSSAARVRDERTCKACGAIVGFNSRWSKVYLVAPSQVKTYERPD